LFREAVRRCQAIGDLHGMVISQTSLCYELTNFGFYDESLTLGETTLPLARQVRAKAQESAILDSLARGYLERGETDRAWQLAQEGVSVAESLKLPEYLAAHLTTLAEVALAMRRLDEARAATRRAEGIIGELSHPFMVVAYRLAKLWLALGQRERAQQAAHAILEELAESGLDAGLMLEALWDTATVLAMTEGTASARGVQERAYHRFLDDLAAFPSPELRRIFVEGRTACRALATFRSSGPRRLVELPAREAPSGRALNRNEWVPIVWTLEAPDDPATDPARRRHQVQRLAAEALAQGGVATVEAMAEAMSVSGRTLLRDLDSLRKEGVVVETRSRTRR
jgi:DNA-binding transcriptional ArsR family regulator